MIYFMDQRRPGDREWIPMVPADSKQAATNELRHWARRGWEVRWGCQGERLPLPEEVTNVVDVVSHPPEPTYLVVDH